MLIDDGSTDKCGEICDDYSKRDRRIRVFHTENRGLSAARNLGIINSFGEYLFFIDGDDWIDENLLEQAIEQIGSADILCFSKHIGSYTGLEALIELINRNIGTNTWNKLYKRKCFSTIRFPEGRIIEDIATTYKLLHQAQNVICMDIRGYHHILRKDSLCQTHNMKNIIDYWLAVNEQYDYCKDAFANSHLSEEERETLNIKLLQFLAYAIARAWAWRNINNPSDAPEWEIMSRMAKTLFPYNIRKHFPKNIRGGLFLARFNVPLSFWLAHIIHVMTRKVSYQ